MPSSKKWNIIINFIINAGIVFKLHKALSPILKITG